MKGLKAKVLGAGECSGLLPTPRALVLPDRFGSGQANHRGG